MHFHALIRPLALPFLLPRTSVPLSLSVPPFLFLLPFIPPSLVDHPSESESLSFALTLTHPYSLSPSHLSPSHPLALPPPHPPTLLPSRPLALPPSKPSNLPTSHPLSLPSFFFVSHFIVYFCFPSLRVASSLDLRVRVAHQLSGTPTPAPYTFWNGCHGQRHGAWGAVRKKNSPELGTGCLCKIRVGLQTCNT